MGAGGLQRGSVFADIGRPDALPAREATNDRGHGFVRDAGGFTTIEAPRSALTAALGGNSRGQVVGGYLDARERFHGFLRSTRGFRKIDFPGANGTSASKINEQGRIVGSYTDERNTPALQFEHGFVLDDDGFTTIDVPGATETLPRSSRRARRPGPPRPTSTTAAGSSVGFYSDRTPGPASGQVGTFRRLPRA